MVYILHERVNVRWSTPQFDGESYPTPKPISDGKTMF